MVALSNQYNLNWNSSKAFCINISEDSSQITEYKIRYGGAKRVKKKSWKSMKITISAPYSSLENKGSIGLS